MGVLNVTPDSFSDGGDHLDPNNAVEHALSMVQQGAEIIDVGGESTRPGAEPISAKEELCRVTPVIEQLRSRTDVTISVDTSNAEVADAAVDAGATIVNDVTGGRGDPQMLALVSRRHVGMVVMHMQGTPKTMQANPQYGDVVADVANFFRQQYTCALDCGIDPMAIAFDPGIGFGKTLGHNLALLGNLERLRVNARAMVIGVSRKSFLSKITQSSDMASRVSATAALTALLWRRGAEVFRVHDVRENVAALRAAEAVLGTG